MKEKAWPSPASAKSRGDSRRETLVARFQRGCGVSGNSAPFLRDRGGMIGTAEGKVREGARSAGSERARCKTGCFWVNAVNNPSLLQV